MRIAGERFFERYFGGTRLSFIRSQQASIAEAVAEPKLLALDSSVSLAGTPSLVSPPPAALAVELSPKNKPPASRKQFSRKSPVVSVSSVAVSEQTTSASPAPAGSSPTPLSTGSTSFDSAQDKSFTTSPLETTPGYGGGAPPRAPAPALSPAPDPVPSPPDTTPPDGVLTIQECAFSLSTSSCLISTTTIHVQWSSADGDLASYDFTADGLTLFAFTTATSTTLTLADTGTHTLSLRARDTTGNLSPATTTSVAVYTKPLAINEVAWGGTTASAGDEWVELINLTPLPLSLATFTLFTPSDPSGPYLPLTGVIPASGYYLVAANASTVPDVPADLIAPFSSGIADSGIELRLVSTSGGSTTTVDRTFSCASWCSLGSPGISLERDDPTTSGINTTDWASNITRIRTGHDRAGNPINGTPKQRNSITHLVNKNNNITSSLTLFLTKSPYLVNQKILTLAAGSTLTIEPGVTIKFTSAGGFSINGTLSAVGTPTLPITFTSFADDTAGGDLNGDGTTIPVPGDWQGITLTAQSTASTFTNTIFRYGAKEDTQAILTILSAPATITDSLFAYGNRYGLYLDHSTSTITRTTFASSTALGTLSAGVYGASSASTFTSNLFTGNTTGVELVSSPATFTNNAFTGNGYRAFVSTNSQGLTITGTTGMNNAQNGITLIGGVGSTGATTTLQANPGFPYLVNASNVYTYNGSTVVIAPGTVIKFGYEVWHVYGNLLFPGSTTSPILITTLADDTDGNDAQNNGPTTGVHGDTSDLVGFLIKPGATTTVDHTEFRWLASPLVYYTGTAIDLADVIFTQNGYGVTASTPAIILRADRLTFTNTGTSPAGVLGM